MLKVLPHHSYSPYAFPTISKQSQGKPIQHEELESKTLENHGESKKKSQLCKKYIDFGYCPFQEKCKFAHGSHELLTNCQSNVKYKTKECQNFKKRYFCCYGKRCNFIHSHRHPEEWTLPDRTDIEIWIVRGMSRRSSRLLELLK